MTRREKQCRRNLSTSLLDATVPSDEIGSSSDCENRAKREIMFVLKRHGGSWVSHVPSRKQELMQVRPAGQAGYPISLVASLDTVPVKCFVPLLYVELDETVKVKNTDNKLVGKLTSSGRSLHLFRWSTHTSV